MVCGAFCDERPLATSAGALVAALNVPCPLWEPLCRPQRP